MKCTTRKYPLTVTVVNNIQLDAREAAFLREMAKHCIATEMKGSAACEAVIKMLDDARVPPYDGAPVYGLFEEQ